MQRRGLRVRRRLDLQAQAAVGLGEGEVEGGADRRLEPLVREQLRVDPEPLGIVSRGQQVEVAREDPGLPLRPGRHPLLQHRDLLLQGAVALGEGGEVGDRHRQRLVEAYAFDRQGGRHTLSNADMGFTYRHTAAPEDYIFVDQNEKKAMLDLAGKIARLGGKAKAADVTAMKDEFNKAFDAAIATEE